MTGEEPEYRLVISRRFLKDLRKLSRQEQLRIRRTLTELEKSPHKGRKVRVAQTGQFRWRVGDLRIRYDIAGSEVHVLRVIKREDAYRKF